MTNTLTFNQKFISHETPSDWNNGDNWVFEQNEQEGIQPLYSKGFGVYESTCNCHNNTTVYFFYRSPYTNKLETWRKIV